MIRGQQKQAGSRFGSLPGLFNIMYKHTDGLIGRTTGLANPFNRFNYLKVDGGWTAH